MLNLELFPGILKYVGMAVATGSTVWAATNVVSREVDGRKNLTRAGKWSIAITLIGFIVSLSSTIIDDRVKERKAREAEERERNKEESAALKELQRMNRIIRSAQPLTSLHLEWTFSGLIPEALRFLELADSTLLDDYQSAFYNVPMRADDAQLLNNEYLLYPFLNSVRDDSLIKEGNVVALISMDESHSAILPIGVVSKTMQGYHNSVEELRKINALYAGGIRFSEDLGAIWGLGPHDGPLRLSRPLSSFPFLLHDTSNATIAWDLDPLTFYNAIDRQAGAAPMLAALPDEIRILLINHIGAMPFEGSNFAVPHESFPWNYYAGAEPKQSALVGDMRLALVPNGWENEQVGYRLDLMIDHVIEDYWADECDVKCLAMVFRRQDDQQ